MSKFVHGLVSVIYATYNRRNDILNALDDLQKQTYNNLEVIVVDNGSTDGTVEAIKKQFTDVTLIALDKNLGCPSGRNVGIRKAKGEFIITLDDDAETEPNAIENGVNIMKDNPDIGVLSGKVITFDTKKPEHWFYNSPIEFIDKSYYTYFFVELSSLLRKKVLDEVGLYPDNFFRQYECRDLGNRILDAGYKIVHTPVILIYHKGPPISLSELYYNYRNSLYIYIKQYPIFQLVTQGIGLTGLFFMHFVKHKKPFLLLKAWHEVIRESRYLLESRKVLKPGTIKYIKQLKKYVNKLPKYYTKVQFRDVNH